METAEKRYIFPFTSIGSATTLSLPDTTGTKEGFTLSNGAHMSEEREYLIRQSLIDYMNDPKEDFRHAGLFGFNGCENIIIRNLSLVGPGAIDVGGDDLLTLSRGSNHIWVDHCDFQDGVDGNFDMNNGTDNVSVIYNINRCKWKLYYWF
mgnify:CR=1 FL=1